MSNGHGIILKFGCLTCLKADDLIRFACYNVFQCYNITWSGYILMTVWHLRWVSKYNMPYQQYCKCMIWENLFIKIFSNNSTTKVQSKSSIRKEWYTQWVSADQTWYLFKSFTQAHIQNLPIKSINHDMLSASKCQEICRKPHRSFKICTLIHNNVNFTNSDTNIFEIALENCSL